MRDGELIEVERRGMDRAFVTDRAVKAERRVLASMRAGRGKGMALANGEMVEKRLEPSRLTRGQREAVRTVLLSNDLVIGVQGHAGSGKTTMLSEVKELLGERKIQGLAPSAVAARVLAREAGIPTRTLQYFLTRFGDLSDPARLARARAEYAGAVLAVDEASMAGSVRIEALLRIARALKVARVVLVGDTKQLKAVDAGQPFRLLQKAGMATATMKEVKRQRDPELRAAVGLAREGEPGAAIAELGNRVREAPPEELGIEAGRRWLALAPEHRADTLILAPTHAICRQANDTVREGLAEEGALRGRTLAVERLVNRRLTRALASDIRSYEPGDTVVFHRDVYGCRANDVCIVMGRDDGRVVLAHPDGERRFRPSGNASRYLGLYDTERIELRAGDRIRWTRNRKAPPARFGHPRAPDMVNGGEAEIVEIGYKRVRFRDGEREFRLALGDPQLRHLDHAYCSTVHSAQGRTARGAIAVLDAGGWVDPELFHVELSRVSEAFLLLTDDREALIERLEAQDWSEDGALEALGIDLSEPPVVDPEEFAALAADWRALLREGEETNTLPFFLPGYRDTMARAAALAQIEDLPEDMRRFIDTMLAEHEGHLARDREVRGLVERVRDHWRRWPELGWAASAQGLPIEELPEHDTWCEEGVALLEAGRSLVVAEGEAARRVVVHHLHAMPGVRAGLEEAVQMLERTRLLDDAERFERAWHALREGAAEIGVPELHAPGHRPVAELGERLEAAEGIDAQVRLAVAEWRKIEAAQAALAEEVRTLPGRIAAWRERRADLPQDEPGGLDPKHPARRAWREEGGALEAVAGDVLRPEDAHAPYLDAVEGQRAGIQQAEEEARDALRDDRRRAFGWLTKEVVRQKREARTGAFHVPRYDEMVAEAQALSGQAELPARTQEVVASWLKYHTRCEPICRQIRELPARADALTADCPERPATLDALRDWRKRAESMIAEASAMLAKKGPHAPHLAAMPGERGELVEATSSLESALLAVKARETNVLSAVVRRSADKFHQDWEAHVAEAKAARVDPFYVVGHTELIDRLQQLRNQPAVTALPASELAQIDSILGEAQRQDRALSHVKEYLAQIEPCRTRLHQLNELAHTQRLELRDVPSYNEWRDAAERLLAAGKAIVDNHKTYGPCLNHTLQAWMDVHASIRELESSLGRDTSSLHHQQPELYLQPVTRSVPTLDEAKDADASYRRLRDEWHKHVALAESTQTHPYHLEGHAALIDAMRELRNLPDLATNARQALDTLLHDYTHLHRDRQHIHAYLDEAEHALEKYQSFEDTMQTLSPLDVRLEDIAGYGEWKDRTLRLADAGEAILADPERFSIHLDHRPDDARRIRSSVAHLNTALGRDDASERRERHQSLSEDEKTTERLSQRRGITP